MVTNEIIGTVIVVAIPLMVSILALITPIIKLNNNITRLNVTIEQIAGDTTGIKSELKKHDEEIAGHETRISLLEHNK